MEIRELYIKMIKRNYIKGILLVIGGILIKVFLIYASLNSYLFIRMTIYMLSVLLIIVEIFIIMSLIQFPLKEQILLLKTGTMLELDINEIKIIDNDIVINETTKLLHSNQSENHYGLELALVANKFELKNETLDVLCQENTDSFIVLNRYKYKEMWEK